VHFIENDYDKNLRRWHSVSVFLPHEVPKESEHLNVQTNIEEINAVSCTACSQSNRESVILILEKHNGRMHTSNRIDQLKERLKEDSASYPFLS
jgi:hypothetical protein